MKVIIAGGRNFNNKALLYALCDKFLQNHWHDLEIVSGMATGADMLGVDYAHDRALPLERFPADWSKGKSAGPMRNKRMAEYADSLIAFWDGKSKGTKNMIEVATTLGLKIRVVKY